MVVTVYISTLPHVHPQCIILGLLGLEARTEDGRHVRKHTVRRGQILINLDELSNQIL